MVIKKIHKAFGNHWSLGFQISYQDSRSLILRACVFSIHWTFQGSGRSLIKFLIKRKLGDYFESWNAHISSLSSLSLPHFHCHEPHIKWSACESSGDGIDSQWFNKTKGNHKKWNQINGTRVCVIRSCTKRNSVCCMHQQRWSGKLWNSLFLVAGWWLAGRDRTPTLTDKKRSSSSGKIVLETKLRTCPCLASPYVVATSSRPPHLPSRKVHSLVCVRRPQLASLLLASSCDHPSSPPPHSRIWRVFASLKGKTPTRWWTPR